VEEARFETLVDRVNTTATVWLGSTVACAQCHNHKFDPLSQKDYYRMLAFYDNAEYTVYGQGEEVVDRWIVEPSWSCPPRAGEAARGAAPGGRLPGAGGRRPGPRGRARGLRAGDRTARAGVERARAGARGGAERASFRRCPTARSWFRGR